MKLSKVFSIITIAVMLLACASNVVCADDGISIGGITINPNKDSNAASQVTSLGNNIIGIVQTVGTIVAVLVIVVLGIKYMMGSAEERAEYKKTLMPYIIGAVLVLLGVNIVSWLITGFTGLFDTAQ